MNSILNGKNHKIVRTNIEDCMSAVDNIIGSQGFYTEVQIKDSRSGAILYHGHNTTVLPGRVAQLEELFDVTRNKEQHLLINDTLVIPHSENDNVIGNRSIRRTCNTFMIGAGAASTEVPQKFYTPKNYETKLYKPIPFRLVPLNNDLSATEQDNYRLRRIEQINGNDYVAYYGKKFNVGSVILEYNSSTYKPIESHTTPVDENDNSHPLGGGSVLAYVQFTLDITEEEVKEYYRITKGTIAGASMSELGLVLGADLPNADDNNRQELAGAELITKITSSLVDLSEEGSSRQVTYRIYAK